jgi:hypothetical protein
VWTALDGAHDIVLVVIGFIQWNPGPQARRLKELPGRESGMP